MLRSPTVGLASNNRPAHIISRLRKRSVETSELSLYQNNFCLAFSQASTTYSVARTVYISSSFCCFTPNQQRIDKSASFKEVHLYPRPFPCSTLSPQNTHVFRPQIQQYSFTMPSLALPTIQPSQSHTPSPSAPAPSASQPVTSQRTRKRSTPPLEEDSDEEEEEDKRRGTGPSKKKASGVWGWEDMGDYKYMVEIRQMVSAGFGPNFTV